MNRQRLRVFSPWPLAASPTGLEIALFTVLSLAHYFDWWRPVSALWRAHHPCRHALGLASPSHRRWHRVSTGMALRGTSIVLTVENRHIRCCLLVFPREERTVVPPAEGSAKELMFTMKKNAWRAVIEVGFIIFLFYSNLLMGEFERSGIG
jgi:hypothetical protein